MAETESHIHDVIVIGAGPCGLALTARLCENTPSSLYSESEHQRYHWMKASAASKRKTKPTRTSRRSHTAPDRLLSGPAIPHTLDIAVLDEKGADWLTSWNENFERLEISHLRSPMFFHPDPRDRDGLLEFVYGEGRERELKEIKGVVGKSLSKHQRKKGGNNRSQETTYLDERDRKDFFRPSQSLFKKHCETIAKRYNISTLVEKSCVTSISYNPDSSSSFGSFTLNTSTGIKKSRIVVFATGASMPPSIPPNFPCNDPNGSICHALSPQLSSFLPPNILTKIAAKKQTGIAVIGGGLTSAQITASAISAGVTKVYHLMRGPFKVKHFDFDLSWVGKYKNFHLAAFWGADGDEERWDVIKEARNGGSITPEYKRILGGLAKSGKVEVREFTEVEKGKWDEAKHKWSLQITGDEVLNIDHIVCATGIALDITQIPSLKSLLETAPIKCVAGLPCLTEDLMWNEDIPLFFTGRLAALRLGPPAANLEGARSGAERIAGKLSEMFGGEEADSGYESGWGGKGDEGVDLRRLGLGWENQFGVLESDAE